MQNRPTFDLKTSAQIAAEYMAGAGPMELAEKYGGSRFTIKTAVRRGGGQIRSKSASYGNRRSDRTGQRSGKLLIQSHGNHPQTDQPGWFCLCDCGNTCFFKTSNIVHARSCGHCDFRAEWSSKKFRTHGKSRGKSRNYNSWTHIKGRCCNPRDRGWKNYGARGIRMCAGWSQSFIPFDKAIGQRPSEKHSLDRINNDGHYSCGECEECRVNGWSFNVRWATRTEQVRNRRKSPHLTFNNETRSLYDWAELVGIPAHVLQLRRKLQWPTEKILTQPCRKLGNGKPESHRLLLLRGAIMDRCYNPNNISYPYYGGRGITVCARWRESGPAFRSDMGSRPSPKHSIDRIDNDKGYWCGKSECPECGPANRKPNCRWATRKNQIANSSRYEASACSSTISTSATTVA
jgi:hypothetical protein